MPSAYEPLFAVQVWDQGEELLEDGKLTCLQKQNLIYEAEIQDDIIAHVQVFFDTLQKNCEFDH